MAKDKKMKKTNAMRILDSRQIQYHYYEYEVDDKHTDGMTVAMTLNQDPNRVFKTLVTQGTSKECYVFVIPVNRELCLKKAALVSNEKKIEMLPMKDLLSKTGYIHGGCSPVGMKKQCITFFHDSITDKETIICSGGMRGLQIEVNVHALLELVNGKVVDIIKS